MSRTEPPRTANLSCADHKRAKVHSVQEQRDALITPLTTRLHALWSKRTLRLSSDEIDLLQLMSTLVRLSDLDVLQTLPIANKVMPPTEKGWDL
jgi:hypothetical protein